MEKGPTSSRVSRSGYYKGQFAGSLEKGVAVEPSLQRRIAEDTKLPTGRADPELLRRERHGVWKMVHRRLRDLQIKEDDAKDNSEFGFVIKFRKIKDETFNQTKETAFFVASCAESRSKWMSHINASSLTDKWTVSNTLVQKKSGFEISRALLMKRNTDKADNMASIFTQSLETNRITKQLDLQIAEIEKAKANIEETYTDQKDMEAALAALQASKDKIVKEKAATTLQMNVRIFLNKLRVKKADLTQDCARTIAKAIRVYCAHRKIRRQIRERKLIV